MTTAVTGNDTIVINDGTGDRSIVDFANADNIVVTFPNELVNMTVGKNGNAIYAFNQTGKIIEAELRLLTGSPDDKYFNSILIKQKTDLPSFVLLTGNFTKRIGDGQGNVGNAVYSMEGGVIYQQVDAKENVEGDTDNAVSVYRLRFANGDRTI